MARKDPVKIIAGAGWIMSFITDFHALVLEHGGSAEDLHRLVKPEGRDLMKNMVQMVVAYNEARTLTLIDVEELRLSQRPYNCIKRVGIDTLFDLTNKSETELRGLAPFLREEDVAEIRDTLSDRGLYLATRPAA